MRSVNGLHLLHKPNAAMVRALPVFIYPAVTAFNNRAETLGKYQNRLECWMLLSRSLFKLIWKLFAAFNPEARVKKSRLHSLTTQNTAGFSTTIITLISSTLQYDHPISHAHSCTCVRTHIHTHTTQ